MNNSIKLLIKKIIFFIDSKTIKTRFFFDGEYLRWKEFNENRKSIVDAVNNKTGKEQKIYYLVPGVKISGGIAVIFQHANRLKKRGYNVKILSLTNKNDAIWFPNQKVEILPFNKTKEILKSGEIDILIATAFSTAFTVDMAQARRKIYFVQSDESRFFSDNNELCKIIKKTYSLPLEYMTEALWIQKWLKNDCGKESYYVPNGLDENLFYKTKPLIAKTEKPRILLEGSINVLFKGMEDAYNAVKDLDCELWIVSNNGKPKSDWKYDKFFENVPYGEMAKIYSSCDIFLKMSRIEGFFGPPMEAMACGSAVVVGKVTGYDEYIVNGENALVVEQGDVDEAKKAIQQLINDGELKNKLIEGGYETVKKWSWEKSIDLLEKVINKEMF
ncbi:MAG: Glycosyl transferase, group 2 family protein [Candidatus Moranbacteria bacterium GW2011_GWE1_35_17]|nr:MAG: Glycosyl transferase, group 2 family protein [Candidatus Moranbacteria bacterium GW2011_GWE1_35_17]KKP89572.1 MAG: Glycosyl transferase, group 2 family protein [Parcubacteria group bacterium GW2011_GWC1_36_108]HCU01659.1 hypothetical protein [Candidatus Nomurabacteria bacterium]